jgi:ribosome-associated translation inhibitor RaiA
MELPIEYVERRESSDTTDAFRAYARHRLSFVVRRFGHRIRRLTVRLVDENGPRRGTDSRCTITADLAEGGQLFVQSMAARPFAAITLASARLGESLRRDGNRHTSRRTRVARQTHRPAYADAAV